MTNNKRLFVSSDKITASIWQRKDGTYRITFQFPAGTKIRKQITKKDVLDFMKYYF